MTDQTADKALFDWRDIAPPPEIHSCECRHCDMGGELEETEWPMLVTFAVAGTEYVTDRYLAARADLAPVPEGYEGPVHAATTPAKFLTTPATDEPANGMHFRWHTIKAIESTGWRLRILAHPDGATEHTRLQVGVVDANGELIGCAIAAKQGDDDEWGTREYVEGPR